MNMNDYSHSRERNPGELVRFALGFIGFGTAGAGVVMSIPAIAVFGGAVFLFVVWSFACGD